MFIERVHKTDGGFIVAIPAEEAERLGLREGQEVSVSLATVERTDGLRPELRRALDEVWPEIEPGLRYLRDR